MDLSIPSTIFISYSVKNAFTFSFWVEIISALLVDFLASMITPTELFALLPL